MKVIIDDWSWKMKVDFTDKVGGAFSTGGGQVGGKEHVVTSLLLFMPEQPDDCRWATLRERKDRQCVGRAGVVGDDRPP
jgi:multimeric flavodoxin WrbA